MNRARWASMVRLVLPLLMATAGASPTAAQGSGPAAGGPPPNIVFFLIDDLGWRDVGFMGSTYYETPAIDRLAREGTVFTSAYANAPNCAPTRASLMTGQYTPRHGIYTVGEPDRGEARDRKLIPIPNRETLPLSALTLAEALRPAGYVMASMGKWHLGDPPTHGPEEQGFDLNVGGFHAGAPRSYFSPYRNPQLPDGPAGEHLTGRLTDEALEFIDANRTRPFFLYLPYYAVHTPIQGKPELVEKYRRKEPSGGQDDPTYAAMIESVDNGIGRILARLEALGLERNTIVVFTSDNGGHGAITSNTPLRGSKGMLYEGGIRVPLAVRWPGVVPAARSTDVPVITSDFFPTLLEAAGVARPAGHPLDGESLVPVLRGADRLERDAIYWHFPAYLQTYRGLPGPWRTTPAGAIRSGDWKLIEYFEDGRVELYDLRNDLGETRNLAGQMPDRASALRQRLVEWRRAVGAPVPDQPNPEYRAPERSTQPRASAAHRAGPTR